MTDPQTIPDEISQIMQLMRDRLGVRAADLTRAMNKAKPRLPRSVYKFGMILAQAEPMIEHPKLRLTLDADALGDAAQEVRKHLDAIDVADRRKGWFLGMLGGLSFNMIAFCVLLVAVLMWRGFI